MEKNYSDSKEHNKNGKVRILSNKYRLPSKHPESSKIHSSITLSCGRCKNSWVYTGKSLYYTSCSRCKSSINIKNGKLNEEIISVDGSFRGSHQQTRSRDKDSL
ncbi:hypothetical protein NMY3_00374 [Candidatus Nitrosocosmicus oleophilus]|uniref:Uncharacterized protein n=1 Tax=Candidatus Nitrosocosmicus oleophilus TaxID=1353260 RepID=A0A654LT94_9ARCH|nr:hypothetical protein NMY3_00374 [Candidatus Nitrosocosmicus oleophilus]